MKLICIKDLYIYSGIRGLIKGKEYNGSLISKEIEVITDYDNYWKHIKLIANSVNFIRKGHKPEDLPQVIPGYKTHREIYRLYTKKIYVPFIYINGEENSLNSFCILNNNQLYELGAEKGRQPSFTSTVIMVDEYFDYKSEKIDTILNDILTK